MGIFTKGTHAIFVELNCLSIYCTRHREFHWRHFGQESCIDLFQIINLGKVYKSQIYRVYLLFMMNAKYISSSVVKNQYYHECVARVYQLIFSPHVWYLLKNLLVLCILYSGELKKANLTFWSFLVRFGSFE